MAKQIEGYLKLQVPAGQASPSPPIGPALGQRGLNIMDFCKAFNAKTQNEEQGTPLPTTITIYVDNLEVEILPAYCNWTHIDGIKYDTTNKTFVEPYLPNHEIGIVHLAGKNNDQIRKNKTYLSEVDTLDNSKIKISLRYSN